LNHERDTFFFIYIPDFTIKFMNIFYTPDICDKLYTLDESESKHCVKVLRKGAGDRLILVDGVGGWYEATITDPNPRRCSVEVIQEIKHFEKRDYSLHLAVSPTKNIERFEWMIEKATEIGVDEITPLLCEHSERKKVNMERLQKVMISAMKQSLKAYLPRLNNLTNFETLSSHSFDGKKFIAHCEEVYKKHLITQIKPTEKVLVLIGPEGDFSPNEIKKARESGFSEVSLGKSRLRTETAGVVVCEVVNLVNEE
jgi:16S rRNA (uracil1498-N3)-methyltransferase